MNYNSNKQIHQYSSSEELLSQSTEKLLSYDNFLYSIFELVLEEDFQCNLYLKRNSNLKKKCHLKRKLQVLLDKCKNYTYFFSDNEVNRTQNVNTAHLPLFTTTYDF